jgi:dihydroorotate dehydrogenase electron transfer subunit
MLKRSRNTWPGQINQLKQTSAIVNSNKEISPGVNLLNVDAPSIAAFSHPGQFAMIRCGPNLALNRPFSIHQVIDDKNISFLFNVLGFSESSTKGSIQSNEDMPTKGTGTFWLSKCRQGDTLNLLGPLGNVFHLNPSSKHLLLIAGGIGIAPLTFLAQRLLKQEKSITLILGSRTVSSLYPQRLLPVEIKTIVTTEDGSAGKKGKVTDVIQPLLDEFDQIFACGPFPMYKALFDLLQQNSIHKEIQISLETRMGCGFGVCYGCSIKTMQGMKTVCKDGPVFNLNDIIWQEVRL